MLAQAAGGLAECAALVAIGHQLRQAGLLRATDGQVPWHSSNERAQQLVRPTPPAENPYARPITAFLRARTSADSTEARQLPDAPLPHCPHAMLVRLHANAASQQPSRAQLQPNARVAPPCSKTTGSRRASTPARGSWLCACVVCSSGPLAPEAWLGAGVALLVSATQAAATWYGLSTQSALNPCLFCTQASGRHTAPLCQTVCECRLSLRAHAGCRVKPVPSARVRCCWAAVWATPCQVWVCP